MPPDLVIFDCDGVLVDSERLSNRAIRDNLCRYGLDLPVERVMEIFVGGTIAGAGEVARGMGADLPAGWVDEIYSEIFEVLGQSVEPVPGIAMVLDQLDASGITYAVGSNGPHRKMEITLGRVGFMERLQGRVYSREDVVNPKPAPDVYLKAAREAGIDPNRCVVVEDSASGAMAGQAAGMRVFGFVADAPAKQLAPHCDHLFDDMAQLPGLLGVAKVI